MAFSLVSTAKNNQFGTGTSGITITKPASLADGDILYAIVAFDRITGGAFASSGWTALDNQGTTAGADLQTTVLRKVITDAGSEPSSYTFTNSDGTSHILNGVIAAIPWRRHINSRRRNGNKRQRRKRRQPAQPFNHHKYKRSISCSRLLNKQPGRR